MHNWHIFGHEWAVAHLQKSIAHARVRHGYLFVGADGVGKETLARAFAATLNCQRTPGQHPCDPHDQPCRSCALILSGSHPDLLYTQTDNGTLKIEEVRATMGRLSLKPFEARYRVAIFGDFDTAAARTQDALLKTLEEPPPYALLFLIAASPESILPTITSRAQTLHLRPVAAVTVRDALIAQGADAEQATLLARLSGGRIGWALNAQRDPALLDQRGAALALLESALAMNRAARFRLAEDLSKDRSALAPLLELWQTYWRDVMLTVEASQLAPANHDHAARIERLADLLVPEAALLALRATGAMIRRLAYNVNLRLALEVMLLDYPGLQRE